MPPAERPPPACPAESTHRLAAPRRAPSSSRRSSARRAPAGGRVAGTRRPTLGGGAAKSSGRHSAVFHSGNRKFAGIRPTTTADSPSIVMRRPMRSGSAPKEERQTSSERSTRSSVPARPSPGSKVRPRTGRTSSMAKTPGETLALARTMGPLPVSRIDTPAVAPSAAANAGDRRHASRTAGDTVCRPVWFDSILTVVSRSASRNGTGRRTRASTSVNIAVVSPMPSPSMAAAARISAGRERRRRSACLRSSSMIQLLNSRSPIASSTRRRRAYSMTAVSGDHETEDPEGQGRLR